MIILWIEGSLLLTQVAFIAVAAYDKDKNGTDVLVLLGNDEAAEQSVTFRGEFIDYIASRAVDEDVETCSRTANTQPRWWRLTLKKPLNISRIIVIGGKDRRGQELQMDKINVTVASDNQSPATECKLSEFLAIEDHYEWHQFNCSKQNSAKIINISDLREISTEFSLCEIKFYEKITSTLELEQEPLIYEGQRSAVGKTWSSKMLCLGVSGSILLLTRWLL